MLTVRSADKRGLSQTDWLKSHHSFSFGEYYDQQYMGFGNLRVINEDTVQPGNGFATHPHNNMEIISYVLEGALEHRDSMENGSIINAGEIQVMSAGTGVTHSEFNPAVTELVHFLQIWIRPKQNNLAPSYQQKKIARVENKWILVGSQNGRDDSLLIHQDLALYLAILTKDHALTYQFNSDHKGWLQLIKGNLKVNEIQLSAGDGLAIEKEPAITVLGIDSAEFLLFDLSNNL